MLAFAIIVGYTLVTALINIEGARDQGNFDEKVGENTQALYDAYMTVDDFLFHMDTTLRYSGQVALRGLFEKSFTNCNQKENYPIIFENGEYCEEFEKVEVHALYKQKVLDEVKKDIFDIERSKFVGLPNDPELSGLDVKDDGKLTLKLVLGKNLEIRNFKPQFSYVYENPSSVEKLDFTLRRYDQIIKFLQTHVGSLIECMKDESITPEIRGPSCLTKTIRTPLQNTVANLEWVEEKDADVFNSFVDFYQGCAFTRKNECTCFYLPPILSQKDKKTYTMKIINNGPALTKFTLEEDEKELRLAGPHYTENIGTELKQEDVDIEFRYDSKGRVDNMNLQWGLFKWSIPGNSGILLYKDKNSKVKFVDTDQYGEFFTLPDCGLVGKDSFKITLIDKDQKYLVFEDGKVELEHPVYKFAIDAS